jgi:hypothetical protein
MNKDLKEYNVVIEYEVQRTFTVYAKNEEQAEELVRNEEAINHRDNWEEIGTLEVLKVA